MKTQKKVLFTVVGVLLACAVFFVGFFAGKAKAARVPDSSFGTGDTWFWSDTTQNMERWVGDTYTFAVTLHNNTAASSGHSTMPISPTYSVGNGKILENYEPQPSFSVNRRDSTTTFYYAFRCLSAGETGVYLQPNKGERMLLFKVKVSSTVGMGSVLGTDASKFSKIVISHMQYDKTITDQQQIAALLQKISTVQLRHIQEDPHMVGWEYGLKLYPADGSGAYQYSDGGSGGFHKEKGCTFNGPEGFYPLQSSSYGKWYATMKQYYENAPGVKRDRTANS